MRLALRALRCAIFNKVFRLALRALRYAKITAALFLLSWLHFYNSTF